MWDYFFRTPIVIPTPVIYAGFNIFVHVVTRYCTNEGQRFIIHPTAKHMLLLMMVVSSNLMALFAFNPVLPWGILGILLIACSFIPQQYEPNPNHPANTPKYVAQYKFYQEKTKKFYRLGMLVGGFGSLMLGIFLHLLL